MKTVTLKCEGHLTYHNEKSSIHMSNYKKVIAKPQINIRKPESIYQTQGEIVNGTFHGRWHFSFGDNYDPEHMQFGTLRVFSDDAGAAQAMGATDLHVSTNGKVELLLVYVLY